MAGAFGAYPSGRAESPFPALCPDGGCYFVLARLAAFRSAVHAVEGLAGAAGGTGGVADGIRRRLQSHLVRRVGSVVELWFQVGLSEEFNVQAYDDDTCVVATLADGNIRVEQSALHLEEDLKPGEQAVFSKRDGKMNRQQANLLVEMAWREGKIVFRRTPMEEVAKVLSRHFNVDVRLQGKEVFDYAYSGTFTTETITEILSLLEKSAPISCEIMEPEQQSDYTFSRKKVLIRLRN